MSAPVIAESRAADAASDLFSLVNSGVLTELVERVTAAPHGVNRRTLNALARDFAGMAATLSDAAGLSDDYRDLTRDFGPVEGDRRCRRLLDEALAPAHHSEDRT